MGRLLVSIKKNWKIQINTNKNCGEKLFQISKYMSCNCNTGSPLTPLKKGYNFSCITDRLASAISLSCWHSLFLRAEISCWNSRTLSGSMPWELIWAARSFSTSAFSSKEEKMKQEKWFYKIKNICRHLRSNKYQWVWNQWSLRKCGF